MEGIRNSISDGDRVDEIEMTDDSELGSHDGSNRPNIEDYDDDW